MVYLLSKANGVYGVESLIFRKNILTSCLIDENTVRATCIAALHARNTREKTSYCVQFTCVIRESNRKIHALACKKLQAVSHEVRVKVSCKDWIQAP